MRKSLIALAILPLFFLSACEQVNESFSKAKKILENDIYFDHRHTIYCGAEFDAGKNVILPNGFIVRGHAERAQRMEWEHAVPVENFGRAFPEWRNGHPECVDSKGKKFRGRKCAEKTNSDFRRMQCDLYNLFPAIGAVNAIRGNSQYAALPDSAKDFGACRSKYTNNKFEPADAAKGQLARAALYMADRYKEYRISRQQQKLFSAWDRQFPVDAWECLRARRIEKAQGNENLFVKKPCREAGLW